jgi:hypothetical protein
LNDSALVTPDLSVRLNVQILCFDFDWPEPSLKAHNIDDFFDRLADREIRVETAELAAPHLSEVKKVLNQERDESFAAHVNQQSLAELIVDAPQPLLNDSYRNVGLAE